MPAEAELRPMGDRKITLFELRFDEGVRIGSRRFGSGSDEAETTESEESSDARSLLASGVKLLVLLGVLALAAKAAISVAGTDDVPPVELDEVVEEVESRAD